MADGKAKCDYPASKQEHLRSAETTAARRPASLRVLRICPASSASWRMNRSSYRWWRITICILLSFLRNRMSICWTVFWTTCCPRRFLSGQIRRNWTEWRRRLPTSGAGNGKNSDGLAQVWQSLSCDGHGRWINSDTTAHGRGGHHQCCGLYAEDGFTRLYPPCRSCSCLGDVFPVGMVRQQF